MSRVATGDTVTLKPTNNIYTVLVGIAVLVELFGFLALFLRHQAAFGVSLFS